MDLYAGAFRMENQGGIGGKITNVSIFLFFRVTPCLEFIFIFPRFAAHALRQEPKDLSFYTNNIIQ